MNSITRNQWIAIISVVLSALMTATAFLTDTFGPDMAKKIVGIAGFANMILSGINTVLASQGQQVRDVAAMPGVERITVNAQAAVPLAAVATDAGQPKVGATDPTTRATLINTARGV